MNPLMAVVDTGGVVEMVRHNLGRQRVYDPLKRPAVRPGVPDVDKHRILFPAAQIDKFLLIEETVSALQNSGILHDHLGPRLLTQLFHGVIIFTGNADAVFLLARYDAAVVVMINEIFA